jgi:hypothetical protein
MFEVRVNGAPVHKEELQVVGVSLQSARGEMYRAGISTEGVVDLRLETVQPGSNIRLDQLDAARAAWERERIANAPEPGPTPPPIGHDMAAKQQVPVSTVLPGVEGGEVSDQPTQGPPDQDLSVGLDPSDDAALTARIEAYNESGDAAKAIADNPPSEPGTEPAPEPAEEEPPSLV